jgi:hypothetical protein
MAGQIAFMHRLSDTRIDTRGGVVVQVDGVHGRGERWVEAEERRTTEASGQKNARQKNRNGAFVIVCPQVL